MSFDFTSLITDRTQEDADRVRALSEKGWEDMTSEEKNKWSVEMKGAYNASDLNRVIGAMEYLLGVFESYGYAVPGYAQVVPQIQLPITNLAPDPTFSSVGSWGVNTVNSMYDTGFGKYGNTSLKIIGLSGSLENTVPSVSAVELNSQHLYYARIECYRQQVSEGVEGVGFYWPIAEPIFGGDVFSQPPNAWQAYSWISSRTTFASGPANMRLDFDNNGTTGTVWYDGLMVIDLTATFGAGNEPDKTWCDMNIPFFSGESGLPSGRWWDVGQVPTQSQMQIYLGNVQALNSLLAALPSTPALPQSMALLNYVEANNIEQVLIDLDGALQRLAQCAVACGPATCGGDYF